MDDADTGGAENGVVGDKWRTRAIVIAVVAIVAIAGLGWMFTNAASERDDAQSDLVAAQGEVDTIEGQLTTAQQDAADAAADAEQASEEADELRGQLGATENARDTAEAALADIEGRFSEVEARAAEADDLEAGIVDFLGVAFQATGMGDDDAQCIAASMVENGDAPTILAAFADVGSSPGLAGPGIFGLTADLLDAADDCGLDLDDLGGGSGLLPGFTYGDNPTLDAMWDDCADGDGAACDQLYNNSEIGSDYEFYGATCGERFSLAEAPVLCEGEI